MGNICKPECLSCEKSSIRIKSSCFDKPIVIYMNDDDEESLRHLEEVLKKVVEKKQSMKK